eukprot:g39717.t1
MYPKLLRKPKKKVTRPLPNIFNSSLATGEDWRAAKLVPLFKKGARDKRETTDREVTRRLDEDNAFDMVSLDFSKTFDKVLHGRLIAKVRLDGIEGNL